MALYKKLTIFDKFDLSDYGFLTVEPIRQLDGQFEEWEKAVSMLSELNKEKKTRECVNSLNTFEWGDLSESWQWKRAYVVLTLLTNSYVFSEEPIDTLPKKLAVPLFYVSKFLGIAPILTHAAVDLYNWHLIDPSKPCCLDNMRSTSLMTGTPSEEWFYLIMVAIERVGGDIIHSLIDIINSIANSDVNSVHKSLISIETNLEECCGIIRRMNERCVPEVFWNDLRPFLGGWKNNDKMPNGLIYEGVSETPFQYCGGSAAESSLLQVIDSMFGIKHESGYFMEIREYMPDKHRKFIEFVDESLNLAEFIEHSDSSDLNSTYERCVKQVKLFRQLHYGLVKTYIIAMKKKMQVESGEVVSSDSDTSSEKGTGGTNLETFLKGAIRETTVKKLGSDR